MKTRALTGFVYTLIWAALLALKWLVPGGWGSLGFDAFFTAVSVIGCIEILRAFGGVSYIQKVITIAFCAVAVPLYVAVQMAMGEGFLALGCCGFIYALILAAVNVFNHGDSTVRGTLVCFLAMLYCGVLASMLSSINHLAENSVAAIIALFFIVTMTDTGGYFSGKLLGKYVPAKLAPKLSPHKTIIGGVGGILGGMVGGVIAYYFHYGFALLLNTPLVYNSAVPGAVAFMLIGFVTSILAQIGDLFESAIKRECDIKDMGKLLPGHGGVLDRFDSMLFSSVIVLFSFGIIIL